MSSASTRSLPPSVEVEQPRVWGWPALGWHERKGAYLLTLRVELVDLVSWQWDCFIIHRFRFRTAVTLFTTWPICRALELGLCIMCVDSVWNFQFMR